MKTFRYVILFLLLACLRASGGVCTGVNLTIHAVQLNGSGSIYVGGTAYVIVNGMSSATYTQQYTSTGGPTQSFQYHFIAEPYVINTVYVGKVGPSTPVVDVSFSAPKGYEVVSVSSTSGTGYETDSFYIRPTIGAAQSLAPGAVAWSTAPNHVEYSFGVGPGRSGIDIGSIYWNTLINNAGTGMADICTLKRVGFNTQSSTEVQLINNASTYVLSQLRTAKVLVNFTQESVSTSTNTVSAFRLDYYANSNVNEAFSQSATAYTLKSGATPFCVIRAVYDPSAQKLRVIRYTHYNNTASSTDYGRAEVSEVTYDSTASAYTLKRGLGTTYSTDAVLDTGTVSQRVVETYSVSGSTISDLIKV